MKREAVEMHGVEPDRVAVTGAQPFDHWFTWQPSTTRDEFCARVGLNAAHGYVLYLCSSKFVAREEAPFVRQWVQQLRQSSAEQVSSLGVLVRPHPQNAAQWRQFDATGLANFSIYPPGGAPPVDANTRSDYYDSIHHSVAVVGINTTAEIESAIVGRPVFTVLAPEFRETQEGTLHFEHLRADTNGLVHVARDFGEHLTQLEMAIGEPLHDHEKGRRFVERFVRPHGLDAAATPRLVAALEAVGARSPRPAISRPVWGPVVQRLLQPWAAQLHQEAKAAAAMKADKIAAQKAKARAKAQAISAKAKARAKAEAEARAREKAAAAEEARRLAAEKTAASSAGGPQQPRDWRDVHRSFQALTEAERNRFMHETGDDIPTEVLMGLYGGRVEQLDFAEATIHMRVTSKPERLRLRACAKEPWTVNWLLHTVRAGEVLYDIGANVGAYSLVAAKKTGGGARVYAFEPSYPNLVALCSNIVLNDLAAQITALPIALSDRNGLDTFMLNNMAPGTARHVLASTGDTGDPDEPTVYPQPVLTYRLDDLIDLCRLPTPNHIKLDVDGGELALLRGASRTLRSPELRSLLMEVTTALSQAVTEELTSCGLRLQTKIDRKTKAGHDLVWYGVFVRDDTQVVHVDTHGVEVASE
jgi:FkbM family methyltransferase